MATLADVQTALAAQTAATEQLITLNDDTKAKLDALIAQGTGVTAADLQAIVDGSTAETARIVADLAKSGPPAASSA